MNAHHRRRGSLVTGALRIIDGHSCPAGEQRLVWNKRGVTGVTGATGPAGPAGVAGAAGPAGPMGPAGSSGVHDLVVLHSGEFLISASAIPTGWQVWVRDGSSDTSATLTVHVICGAVSGVATS